MFASVQIMCFMSPENIFLIFLKFCIKVLFTIQYIIFYSNVYLSYKSNALYIFLIFF
jgi:hypothetical protein